MTDVSPEIALQTAHLTVRLDAIQANYREVARRASPAAVAPVVKADAYGLGLGHIAPTLAQCGADTFFVARLAEGIAARRLLPRARIFVLDGLLPGTANAFLTHRLTPVLNAYDEVVEWAGFARERGHRLEAALHVDTGMNRSGLSRAELNQVASSNRELFAHVNLALVMSHLACADDSSDAMNRTQLDRFRAALALLPAAPASLAASAGVGLGKDYLFDIVRPGLALYGGNPRAGEPNPYKVAAKMTANILQIRRTEQGETVGYGASFETRRPSVLATVALGYADGLMRAMGRNGRVALAGCLVPFAGRISMDLVTLDVTDVPMSELTRGAEVEFVGDTITLEAVARAAGTINHEVLTGLHPRAARIYVGA